MNPKDTLPTSVIAGRLPARPRSTLATMIVVWGPGLLVMLADTDVGNIVTAAQSGTQWGYRLVALPLLLIPLLYMIQELTVRIGLFSGCGFGEFVRLRCGRSWARLAAAALAIATVSSLVTELVGIAGVGEMYGVSRAVVLPLAALCLTLVMLSGKYRRVERIAVLIGMFELSFLVVAYAAHPALAEIAGDVARQPFSDFGYLYLNAALIGATFNPWMIFYQPSALAEKKLGAEHYRAARWDTAAGAALTQILTASVIVAAAATLGVGGSRASLDSVGQISEALTPFLGGTFGRLAFGAGVVGAALVAAIVCSLAFAWGLGEIAGMTRAREHETLRRRWFVLLYTGCVIGGAILVLLVPDLIWLTIWAQVVNALLMPLVVGLLVVLAARHLPPARRLRGWYLWLVIATATVVSVAGLIGAAAGLA
jgi:Mn2+/Fe2+ NRAMP family transporter